jgi:hypothetical protein
MLKIILYIGMSSLLVGCHKFLPPSKENNLHRIGNPFFKFTILRIIKKLTKKKNQHIKKTHYYKLKEIMKQPIKKVVLMIWHWESYWLFFQLLYCGSMNEGNLCKNQNKFYFIEQS